MPDGTPDGTHAARIVAEDASGNETAVARTISVDGTPPRVLIERARGRSIVLSLSTRAPASQRDARGPAQLDRAYRTLNPTFKNGRLRAKLDRGNASRIDMRVTVRDNAGNVAQGNPTRLSATSAKVGRRFRRVRSGRVKIPFGRRATFRGRLTLSAGQSLPARRSSPPRRSASGAPDEGGRHCRHRSPRPLLDQGPRRPEPHLPPRVPGSGGALGSARGVSVRVPASSTIHASRTRLGGGRVRFSGRLRNRGQRIPGRGLVLVLQGRERGKWRTFKDTRTNRKGRWHVSYRFSGRPGSYPIRVRIRKQSGFPSSSATRAG